MNGFHSFSSAAFFAKNPGKKLTMSLPDIYCTVISALQWRKNGNSITMLTDSAGAELFSALGINDIWNDIKVVIPDDLDGIDPVMFWAGGKLIALQQFSAPCAMIDTDFIVWEDPPFEDKIIAAHEEDLMPSVYPDVSSFRLKGKVLDEGLDYTTLPLNTAFLYIPDEDFKQYYTSRSIAFMKLAVYGGDYLTYMVFAEQRLLPMLAKRCGIGYTTLLDKDRLFLPQSRYTHLWGAKQKMRDDKAQLDKFCERCRERIRKSYPEYEYIIGNIERAEK